MRKKQNQTPEWEKVMDALRQTPEGQKLIKNEFEKARTRAQQRDAMYGNLLSFVERVANGNANSEAEIQLLPKVVELITGENEHFWRLG